MGAQFLLLLTYILIFGVALMFVALGGMFSERSGVINIGLEGIMVVGGFVGLVTLNGLSSTTCPGWLIVIITILSSIVYGREHRKSTKRLGEYKDLAKALRKHEKGYSNNEGATDEIKDEI